MRPRTRMLLIVAALLMVVAYVAPLWQIGLEAPQYPEGLGMSIWIDTITGQKPNDLNSINNLNHYIGMKAIVPESIPELRVMPLIVGGLIALGLLAAVTGKRSLLYLWTVCFALAALGGLADFWIWSYDYGHNLDPTAAIKVPGLSYQPPLIGSKKLLNFTANSWPGLGGTALAASLLVGVVLSFIELRRNRRLALVSVAAVAMVACAAPGPGDIHYDTDACDHCRMTISDPKFAAQLVTRTGKIYRFDDPWCLASFVAAARVPDRDVHSIWLNDHAHPNTRVTSGDALFVVSDSIRAPMNGGAAAFGTRGDAEAFQSSAGGRVEHWADILGRKSS
jgi:copper chaperone NosL